MNSKKVDKLCCPEFDVTPWENQTHLWTQKPFIKGSIPLFFHIPLPFAVTYIIKKLWNCAELSGAAPELKDFLMLSYDPSPWKGEYYLFVKKDVPNAKNIKLSGTFISKVFDGPYSSIPKFIKEMEKYVTAQGKIPKKYYFYYTTCPKCAKKYGHNYIVTFAEI